MNKFETDINIRVATSNDIQKIYNIEKECFSTPWSESSISSTMNGTNTYFAIAQKDNAEIVGYAGLYFAGNEGYMYNIAVKSGLRHLGVGTKLINNLKNFCIRNSMEFLSLEVRKSNIPAVKLYQKMNFKIVGSRKNFYTSPTEDALIMTVYF